MKFSLHPLTLALLLAHVPAMANTDVNIDLHTNSSADTIKTGRNTATAQPTLTNPSSPNAAEDTAEKDTAEKGSIERVQVTGVVLSTPGQLQMDPKAPRQPLPAHDGADYLKTIPGFAVTRKGGADGDALFRGMAGSRLGILVDGENILGGCNFRMDAPTAYIYPELHDNMTVIKGPQSVAHGAGHSAAVILFERRSERFAQPGFRLHSSATAASFGRHDELIDLQLGQPDGYVILSGSHSTADNYRDGDGVTVHSSYQRYSGNVALGWTPDENSKVELALSRSDGEAAYADRGMDGTRFLRESVNLRGETSDLTPWLTTLKFHWFDNDVDHVMDDQTLRQPGMMGYANLRRQTSGGRISAQLATSLQDEWTLGLDTQDSSHSSRSAPKSAVYSNWLDDAAIAQTGLFAEWRHQFAPTQKMVSGYRIDRWQADDERLRISSGMMGSMPNPTAGAERKDNLHSGFARFEQKLTTQPASWYLGLGSTARFPDYWELIAKEGVGTPSAFFQLQAEKTRQLDTGYLYKDQQREWSVSAFFNDIDDFILVDYKMKTNGLVRNIDARSYGAEFGFQQQLDAHWRTETTLAYTKGDNKTNDTPLPQLSPVELKLGLSYARQQWSVGSLVRFVGPQHRVALGEGNIVGKDLGPSAGFAILALNANWQITPALLLTGGADNLLDKNYAEFVSRAGGNGMGGAIPGFEQTLRVNEPGRTLWLKLQWNFVSDF
ncbi:MAG: TonB-dependent copper receptor [Gammaproteobacteria bacterium]|nr:TonB-dependent copper receptor [Gammaproteobacteria bacterium]